ncbi:hypothetical protein M9435_003017 [Picochlorum sp. BPE23]|nr:hypothetical protein M9435_003017 [Picochlorum sp. BPE23]
MSQNFYINAITEIASAGTLGVPLRDVFEKHIPEPLVDFVWNRLKAARGDVLLYRGEDLVGQDDAMLLSYQSATEGGIRVKASSELYHAYLGIYGQELQRFQYSEPQITTLFLVQKAGKAGILQNELCASIGLKPNNFGYVMQALEERGKIFRRKVTVKRNDQKGTAFTHYVYLMRYKSDVDTNASDDTQFQNDTLEFQRILDELEKSDVTTDAGEKLAIEGRLKMALHFTGEKQGHKRWRRLRDKMISLNLIESFQGVTMDGKEENFIKKIKSSAADESLQVRVQPSFHMPVRTLAHQVVELSMDRQFLIEIAKTGTAGATSSDLSEILGFNLKRHNIRFQDFEARFKGAENASISLNVSKTVVGRSSQYVYSVTRGVAENILSASEALVGTEFCQQVLARFEGGQMPDDAHASADEQDPSKIKYVTESGQVLTTDFSYRLHWLVEIVKEKGFFLSMQASEYLLQKEKERKGTERKLPKDMDKKQIMRIAHMAEKHKLLHIVNVQVPSKSGVTGSQNVTVFLPHGVKMSEELLEKILKVYLDTFKSKAPNTAAAAPAIKPVVKGTFKKQVRSPQVASFEIYKIQQDNGYHRCKMHRCEVLLECITRMVESRSCDYSSESFESLLQELQTSNSEIRCVLEVPETRSVDENGQVKIRRQQLSVFKPTMDNKRKIFTREQVWDTLTVDEFAKALGFAGKDKDFLDRARSKYVRDLSKKDLIKIAGGEGQITTAVVHMKKVLEVLTQLGVLKSIVSSSMSKEAQEFSRFKSDQETGYYMLNDVAVHETRDSTREPLSPTTEGNLGGRALKSFDLTCPRNRKGYWISLQYLYYSSKYAIHNSKSNLGRAYFPMDRTEKTFAEANRVEKNVDKVKSEVGDPGRANIPVSWEHMFELSHHLDVPIDDVIHALIEITLRKRNLIEGFDKSREKGPRKRQVKRQKVNIEESSKADVIEEDEEELLLLQPEAQTPPTRKRKWQDHEDRQLLYDWVRWLAAHGVHSRIKWNKMLANIPDGIKIGSYKNRIAKLCSDECVKEYIMEIKSEANNVFVRHSSLKDPSDSKNKTQRFTGHNLFEVKGDEDLKSIQTILDKIERVVQEAPERPAEVLGVASSRVDRFVKAYPVRSGPSQFFAWLRNYCAKAKWTANSRQAPSIEVTCAMAAVLAALYEIEFLGKAAEDMKNTLGYRFTSEVLKIGCKNLVQNDLIVAERDAEEEASKGTYFALSRQFKVEMKPPFSPLAILEDNKPLFSAEGGALWPLPSAYSPLSVSPMLALSVMGYAPFQITIPDDVQDALDSFKSEENSFVQLGQHCLERNMVYAQMQDPASAMNVCHVAPVRGQPVLYQPSNLSESSKVYQKARKSFLKESKSVLGANLGNSILETVTNAGPDGITMDALQSVLELNNLSVESAVVGNLLQKYGLARIIRGYDETYVASAMATGHLVSIKNPHRSADAMEIDGKPSEHPLSESPLRPWIDSNGTLIESLWQSFVMRVVDIVCRFPGINGEMLIQALRSLPPAFAKEVITSLCESDVLYFTTSTSNQRTPEYMNNGILSDNFRYSLKNEMPHLEDIFAISSSNRDPFADARQQPADQCFFVHPGKVLDAKNAIPSYIC